MPTEQEQLLALTKTMKELVGVAIRTMEHNARIQIPKKKACLGDFGVAELMTGIEDRLDLIAVKLEKYDPELEAPSG